MRTQINNPFKQVFESIGLAKPVYRTMCFIEMNGKGTSLKLVNDRPAKWTETSPDKSLKSMYELDKSPTRTVYLNEEPIGLEASGYPRLEVIHYVYEDVSSTDDAPELRMIKQSTRSVYGDKAVRQELAKHGLTL